MMGWTFAGPLTGLDIAESSLRIAQIARGKKTWHLIHCGEVPLEEEVFELSHKSRNIVDFPMFQQALRDALKLVGGRVTRLGLSLPNESIKVSVQRHEHLPKARAKVDQLIGWREKSTLPFPLEDARISYCPFSHPSREETTVLVSIAARNIIREYENAVRQMGLEPAVIRPAGINHANFFLEGMAPEGVIAFLGLFEHYFTFFVFQEGQLVYYRGKRRPIQWVHFLQEIDMSMDLYRQESPGREVSTLYVASEAGPLKSLKADLSGYSVMAVSSLEGSELFLPAPDPEGQGDGVDMAKYASAMGAAKSLVE